VNRSKPYLKGKISLRWLAILSLFTLCALLLVEAAKYSYEDPLSAEKAAAARLMQEALRAVKDEKISKGIKIDPILDPNETGIIGVEYNDLTTTLGSLSSKRISTDPEFAAVVVDMLSQTGIQAGDVVLISFSGSFPALNIAALSAARVLRLQPVIISSIGASSYGANDPELTWLDMERVLSEKRIFPYRSAAASLGGITETKGGLDRTGISAALQAIRRNGIPILEEEGESTLRDDIQRRMTIYDKALTDRRPAAFISVGGPLTSLGNTPEALKLSSGLLKKVPVSRHPERGIIYLMGERKVPVIHLLQVRKIARVYGITANRFPALGLAPGKGQHNGRYSIPLALISLTALLLLTIIAGRGTMILKGRGRSGPV